MLKELLIYFREDSLEFWSKDLNNRLVEIEVEHSNIVPLFFFQTKDELSIGEFAKEQFNKEITGAYGDYWNNVLVNNLKFSRFHTTYPFQEMLFFCIKENLLKDIVRHYFDNQPLDKFLKSGKVLLLFESFINEDLRSMVLTGFIETIGFDTSKIINVDYWDAFSNWHINIGTLKKEESFVEVNEAYTDLYFNLISKAPAKLLNRKVLKGRGNDPLLDTILDYISEKAVARGSLLSIEAAKKELFKDGQAILEKLSEVGLIQHKMRLSDTPPFTHSFHSDALLTKLNYKSSLNFVQNEFDSFRNQNKVQKIKIFLNGKTLNSPSFRDFFKSTYCYVYPEDPNFKESLILETLIRTNGDVRPELPDTTAGRRPPPPPPPGRVPQPPQHQPSPGTGMKTPGIPEMPKHSVREMPRVAVPPPLPSVSQKPDEMKRVAPPPPPPPSIKKEAAPQKKIVPPPPPPVIKKSTEHQKKVVPPPPPLKKK